MNNKRVPPLVEVTFCSFIFSPLQSRRARSVHRATVLVSAVSAAKGTPPLHSGANDDPCSRVAPRSCGCRCTQPCSSTKSCANSTSRFLEHEHPHGSADRLRNRNQTQTHHPSYWSRCSTSGQPSDPAGLFVPLPSHQRPGRFHPASPRTHWESPSIPFPMPVHASPIKRLSARPWTLARLGRCSTFSAAREQMKEIPPKSWARQDTHRIHSPAPCSPSSSRRQTSASSPPLQPSAL